MAMARAGKAGRVDEAGAVQAGLAGAGPEEVSVEGASAPEAAPEAEAEASASASAAGRGSAPGRAAMPDGASCLAVPRRAGRETCGRLARAADRVARAEAMRRLGIVMAVCARVADGESVAEVLRDPRMPTRRKFDCWVKADPVLTAKLAEARAKGGWPQGLRRAEGPRRDVHLWSEALGAEVLEAIAAGRSLVEVCADPGMPTATSVLRWLRERPEFLEAYRRAREAQADRLFDLAWTIALEAEGRAGVAEARLKIQTLKWRVGVLSPWKYGRAQGAAAGPPAPAAGGGDEGFAGLPAGACAADGGAGDGDSDGGADGGRIVVEVRRFARAPGGEVVEITHLVRGLSPPQVAALRAEIEAGRRVVAPRGGEEGDAGG